jgi:hypothetical protein
MNMMVDIDTLERPETKPVAAPVMTKKEKLTRWATLIRQASLPVYLMSNLEYRSPDQLATIWHPNSPWAVAALDPELSAAGLKADLPSPHERYPNQTSAAEAMRFFELSQEELHAFSCDCGGAISNANMADRIERIAARS